jgi:VWFA-related protein
MKRAKRGALHHAASRLGLLLLLFLCPHIFPQGKAKKETTPERQSTFSVKLNAVVVKATVTDRSGSPVTDLTKSDFRIYEDGKPQEIQTFALESVDPPESEEAIAPDTLPSSKSGREPVARSPRLISIVIDDLTMGSPSQPGSIFDYPRMVAAVKKFVKTDMRPTDQVTILSGSRNVQFPYTDYKHRLLEELDSISKKLNTNWAFRAEGMSDYAAWMRANDLASEGGIGKQKEIEWKRIQALVQNDDVQSRTRNLLYTIRQHLRTLGHFEGTKMVVLFSDGFISQAGRFTGAAIAYKLQEIVNLALHSGITLNTVSTRSVTAESLIEIQDQTGVPFNVPGEMDRMMQEQPMEQIAFETGGEFFPRSNDMYLGLKSIAHRRHSYYVLTYAMPSHKPDGAYHHIKLEVTRPDLALSHRKGYYSPTEELTFETSKREEIMEALHGPGNMNEIPITLSYNLSQEDDSTYAVSFISNVNVRGMQFPEGDARRRNQISIVLAAFDENDHFISGLEKSIDFQLLESSYANLRERGLVSRVELKLPPGTYKVKAVVRENAQGKMGSVTRAVEIP